MTRNDSIYRNSITDRSPHTLYAPLPRRSQPFDWTWPFVAIVCAGVFALFFGGACLRFGL